MNAIYRAEKRFYNYFYNDLTTVVFIFCLLMCTLPHLVLDLFLVKIKYM